MSDTPGVSPRCNPTGRPGPVLCRTAKSQEPGMAPIVRSDDNKDGHPRSNSVTPRQGRTMQDMTTDELAELLAQLELSTEDSRDELLTDFLVRPYPTKHTQDN